MCQRKGSRNLMLHYWTIATDRFKEEGCCLHFHDFKGITKLCHYKNKTPSMAFSVTIADKFHQTKNEKRYDKFGMLWLPPGLLLLDFRETCLWENCEAMSKTEMSIRCNGEGSHMACCISHVGRMTNCTFSYCHYNFFYCVEKKICTGTNEFTSIFLFFSLPSFLSYFFFLNQQD